MQIIREPISMPELKKMAEEIFGDLVKIVVDAEQEIIVASLELHADGEVFLMEKAGSKRENTWGINLYPGKTGDEFIEFDSMINLKPSFGNRSRGVENELTREKIKKIVKTLIHE